MKNIQKRRNKVEIYIDVLKTINIERSPTRISQIANISWTEFTKEILPSLMMSNLISNSPADSTDKKRKSFYHLTVRGRETLALWEELKRRLGLK